MTGSQQKVLYWLATHDGWHAPGKIKPTDYPGSASCVGRVLRSLVEQGRVEVRVSHRTKGGRAIGFVYRAKSTIKVTKSAMRKGGEL
jgi:hypothetical protein